MGAVTFVIIAVCIVVGIYLYVMGLCYLCDLHERRKAAKREAEEKRRKEDLQLALEQAEARRRQEIERRKNLAQARRQKPAGNSGMPKRPARPHQAPAAS